MNKTINDITPKEWDEVRMNEIIYGTSHPEAVIDTFRNKLETNKFINPCIDFPECFCEGTCQGKRLKAIAQNGNIGYTDFSIVQDPTDFTPSVDVYDEVDKLYEEK